MADGLVFVNRIAFLVLAACCVFNPKPKTQNPKPKIQKLLGVNLNQITVPSINLEQSIPFYEMLGLQLIVKALPHYARFECSVGEATFSLHQVEQLPTGEGVYVYFEIENLDEYVAELVKKGIEFDELPNDKTWLWREARLRDIDGNRIILYWAGDNRKNPPWRVG